MRVRTSRVSGYPGGSRVGRGTTVGATAGHARARASVRQRMEADASHDGPRRSVPGARWPDSIRSGPDLRSRRSRERSIQRWHSHALAEDGWDGMRPAVRPHEGKMRPRFLDHGQQATTHRPPERPSPPRTPTVKRSAHGVRDLALAPTPLEPDASPTLPGSRPHQVEGKGKGTGESSFAAGASASHGGTRLSSPAEKGSRSAGDWARTGTRLWGPWTMGAAVISVMSAPDRQHPNGNSPGHDRREFKVGKVQRNLTVGHRPREKQSLAPCQ
ncbi:MAG: hypothetical protein M1826_000370 [Phylliscum demangeonii]|nr:MAG: hypothetical protein M1826_000370 [Phylliscum demangeonii]